MSSGAPRLDDCALRARLTNAVQAGLDSLGAVELRNALSERFGAPLPTTFVFDYPTVEALAHALAPKTLAVRPEVVSHCPCRTKRMRGSPT